MFDTDAREMILGAMAARSRERSRQESTVPIRASAIGNCPRSTALELLGTPAARATSDAALAIMDVGTAWHERIQQAVSRTYPQTLCEVETWTALPLHESTAVAAYDALADRHAAAGHDVGNMPVKLVDGMLFMRGRADMVVPYGSTGYARVHEIKSKSSFGFGLIDKEGADEAHVAQGAINSHAVRNGGPHVLKGTDGFFYIDYVNRDTGDVRSIRFGDADPEVTEIVDRMLGRVVQAIKAMLAGDVSLAPPVFAKGVGPRKLPWQCNYCKYGPSVGGCVPPDGLVNKGSAAKPNYYAT